MATPFRLKRSAVSGKRPELIDLQLGELAINFYDGHLFAERDTGGVGIGTTVTLLTPWVEGFGGSKITYVGDRVIIEGTNSLQIPVGNTAQRDAVGTAVTGQIRYNTSTSSFEGYGTGSSWGSLGGIKDVDQDTFIRAETSAGSDEDTLEFLTVNSVRVSIDPNGNVGIGTTTADGAADTNNTTILNVGVVTANTYHGDQVIGTPSSGSFRVGAISATEEDLTKDSIEELNFILGKLVPTAPDTIDGATITLTGTAGNARLCAGFTPTNNTGGSAPVAGTQYTRNTDSTITSNYITEFGPGDSGTVEGFVNATGIGSTALNVSFGIAAVKSDNGTYGALQIRNDKDAADSTRNVGITSLFYEVYDARFINAASPDGFNKAHISQLGDNTADVFWYEDPSTVGAPVITFINPTPPNPATHNVANSSGIPHYTNNAANNFLYQVAVTNATGDMYNQNTFVTTPGGTTSIFENLGNFDYTDFTDGGGGTPRAGTNPPVRNFGVGAGFAPAVAVVTQIVRDLHITATTNYFSLFTATTPYGTDVEERPADLVGITGINIMGTTARTNVIDEDNIAINSLGTGAGNATRVNAGAAADNPTPIFTAFNANGALNNQEAAVRGGVLRHDQTNYTTFLPTGPNLSVGRNGAQYFQLELIRSNVSEFSITYSGSCSGCFVCMPNNTTWTTSLSGTNGWADMFQAYRGAGIPTSAEPGCSSGGLMTSNGGTFTCVFGTESSSNDSNNRILIRWRLDAGDSITAMSFSAT
tara:strand:- start:1485 stop:3761 length:2277 start_codon:yes stop_codon:yes gene_type:complete